MKAWQLWNCLCQLGLLLGLMNMKKVEVHLERSCRVYSRVSVTRPNNPFTCRNREMPGKVYDELTTIQKQWLVQWSRPWRIHTFSLKELIMEEYRVSYTSGPQKHIKVKPFTATTKPVIAVELLEAKHWKDGQIVHDTCFRQLMSVINFAHDQGGKRVVIINHTDTFSNDALLHQIIKQVPNSEKERTGDRLRLLLGL